MIWGCLCTKTVYIGGRKLKCHNRKQVMRATMASKKEKMNINNLTIGQAKESASIFVAPKGKAHQAD